MIDINSVTYEQLNNVITDLGQPEFRTKQIFTWLHKNGVSSFDEMTNISKSLREKLSEKINIYQKLTAPLNIFLNFRTVNIWNLLL